jgi:glycine/D-amino acid oxidase-like deaminating enzyme
METSRRRLRRATGKVAVLGAGITGCSTALFMARQGYDVTLFDQASQPFEGSSGWNDGKLHLGYLYAADPGLGTARQLLTGGLLFRDIVEELLGGSIAPATAPRDDVFLLHRDSVVQQTGIESYFRRVSDLVRSHPDAGRYWDDAARRGAVALTEAEMAAIAPAGGAIVGAWRLPERSVSSRWIARRYLAALAAEPRVEQRLGTRVLSVSPGAEGLDGPFEIRTPAGTDGPFTIVVNALWEGRSVIDQAIGLPPQSELTHRYRYALFIHTAKPVPQPNALIGTGPFGDVKAYGERDFYLSWYPAGLVAVGEEAAPPPLPALDEGARAALKARILDGLAEHLPAVRQVADGAAQVELRGSWVVAQGRGRLDDPAAGLHRRDRFGIRRSGRYVSVDCGKFSTAPWMAREVAAMFRGG